MATWSYQWITGVDWALDSSTAPLKAMRIPPGQDTITATIAPVRRLLGLLSGNGPTPMFVFDAGFDPIALTDALAAENAQLLVRPQRPGLLRRSRSPPRR